MARRLLVIESGALLRARRVAEWIEQRSSFYGPLFREGLGLWEAVPAAQVHRGSSGDQTHGGACRMERFVLGQDVPDSLGELAGKIDAGDLRAALAPEALLRALVSLAIAGVSRGMGRGLDQRPAQIRRAVLGQRSAPVLATGLADQWAQPGVPGELLGAREAVDVADLGGDRVGEHPAHPGARVERGIERMRTA